MPAPAHPWTAAGTAALLAALSLVLSGCSASDAPEATASPSTGYEGPLTEYLAPVTEALTGEDAQLALNIEIQEGIATCMAEAGFDYIPYIAPETIHLEVSDKGTRDWVARVGYDLSGGMLEGPERDAWIASGVANAARPPSVDPNDAIYAQLSEGTKAAYDLALNGPPLSNDRDESTPWSRADGCYTWAAFVQHADRDTAFFADYADLLERMYATTWRDLDTHPRMVDLATEWAHCMADAGHVYTSPTDAWESVSAVIQGTPGPDGDPYITSDEVKALEIAVALADYDCKEAVDWETVRDSVIDEVEAQFLADNKAEIDEYIDYVVQASQAK
ncbi:hypothetical protein SAMN05216410_1727 [Sanguibacter gelidistatuariae]|uniref:Uncharacterized protein n=1 Tax=Sanguibacter gelidistatuariae TaxID=1814289 RepID=A0A1G6KZZ4_9MICO|nr:hypothetical protein [Sanguibacter gelidistatuariae]SDC36388.1 hypothetical protein SAMN05216410_1727 [Sanguibacter gelidistatuariae]